MPTHGAMTSSRLRGRLLAAQHREASGAKLEWAVNMRWEAISGIESIMELFFTNMEVKCKRGMEYKI